jgi:acyl-CoA synthetase (AMP-forming)/AMP-acid ligase II
VFGVPDNTMGEDVAAWIKLEERANVMEEAIILRELSLFYIP